VSVENGSLFVVRTTHNIFLPLSFFFFKPPSPPLKLRSCFRANKKIKIKKRGVGKEQGMIVWNSL
jgi:hypothetical protein